MLNTREIRPISAILFDFGRVITRDQDPACAQEMAAILGAEFARFQEAYYHFRLDYDRGLFRAPEYWGRVARRLGTTLRESDIPRLITLDLEGWFLFDPEMTELIAALRPKVARMVLLSNIPHEGAAKMRSGTFAWKRHFDDFLLSAEHGLVKPEPAIYSLGSRMAQVDPARCLFVDDMAGNIEAARAFGMNGHVYSGIEGLVADLEAGYRLETGSAG